MTETYAVTPLGVTPTMLFAVFRFLYVENVTCWAAGAFGWVPLVHQVQACFEEACS